MTKLTRRMITLFMALLLVASMPMAVFAEEYDLTKGDVVVDAKEDGTYVTQQDNNIIGRKETTGTVIMQSNPDTATDNTITVNAEENVEVTVSIQDVNIDVQSAREAAMTVNRAEGSTVTVELENVNADENTLISGGNHAGLETTGEGTLVIQDADNDAALSATGDFRGAGIGGSAGEDGINITISGGVVTATGNRSAGIGGGMEGNGRNITISGGDVTALASCGAGIGGGQNGNGEAITISGGKVDAMSEIAGAGIGGGQRGDGIEIAISGGEVDAKAGMEGAGIGGGIRGNGVDITISGGKVTATAGVYHAYMGYSAGAGIGGGNNANAIGITITGGEVVATGAMHGAGIGGGGEGRIDGNATDITISGGKVIATGGDCASGIGGTHNRTGSNIVIKNDAVVIVTGNGQAEDIGSCPASGSTVNENTTGTADISELYTTGSVNGIPGEVPAPTEPPATEPPAEEETSDDDHPPVVLYTVDTKWEEVWDWENSTLIVTAMKDGEKADEAIFTTWGYGLRVLMDGYKLKTIRFITAGSERELDIAELRKLVAKEYDEYDLIHKGSENTLKLNEENVEEKLLDLRQANK